MDVSKFLKGTYLTAADIEDDGSGGMVCQITGCNTAVFDSVDGTKVEKVVLTTNRGSVALNKTNLGAIVDAYGSQADNWEGQPVKLVKERVNFGGRMVDAIRIKCKAARKQTRPAPTQQRTTRPAQEEPLTPTRDDYDDIPF
jgi:hypothetical protein